MVFHPHGFFRVSSISLTLWISYHTLSRWMVSHQCGLFHVSSNSLTLWISCHILSSWMVSHQYGFFHVSSNSVLHWIAYHTSSSWMVSHQCGFFHAFSEHCHLRISLSCGYDIGVRHSMDSFMFLQIPCLAKLLITLWTAEWFFFCVDSFMGL